MCRDFPSADYRNGARTHIIEIHRDRQQTGRSTSAPIEDGRVSFEYKDYADGNQAKVMSLAATEFIRRFLLHILPSGFARIRQYGFLSNRERRKKLASCRVMLGVSAPSPSASIRKQESTEREPRVCIACGRGHMIGWPLFRAQVHQHRHHAWIPPDTKDHDAGSNASLA